jgi:hypothetical protein
LPKFTFAFFDLPRNTFNLMLPVTVGTAATRRTSVRIPACGSPAPGSSEILASAIRLIRKLKPSLAVVDFRDARKQVCYSSIFIFHCQKGNNNRGIVLANVEVLSGYKMPARTKKRTQNESNG